MNLPGVKLPEVNPSRWYCQWMGAMCALFGALLQTILRRKRNA